MKTFLTWISLVVLCLSAHAKSAAGFALNDGDRVVFLGDSITAARTYGKIVENYTLLRYPDRKVRFFNAGRGGDTMSGCLERLERDVFVHQPSVLIVAFGINDIGWGMKANEEHKQKYLNGIRELIARCQKKNIRVFICSAAVTGADPHKTETEFLQVMCDEGMALARSLGEKSIDVQRTMRSVQKSIWKFNESIKDTSKKETLHAADGIHLNDLGQLAMAFGIIKGLGAPAEVSSARLNADTLKVVETRDCSISKLERTERGIRFIREDQGLPINFGAFGILQFRFVPIPEEINRYMLQVDQLPEGQYELKVEGRQLGKWSHQQLAKGLNISSATVTGWEPGGPWDAQATFLVHVTEARNQLSLSKFHRREFLPGHPQSKQLDASTQQVNDSIEKLQRDLVRPFAYRFELNKL